MTVLGLKVMTVHKAHKVMKAQVLKVLMEHKVVMVHRVHKVQLVLGLKVPKVLMELDLKVPKVLMGHKVQQVLLAVQLHTDQCKII